MNVVARSLPVLLADDMDALRLVALSRVPRCEGCPRFAALCAAHATRTRGGRLPPSLPDVPEYCHAVYCAPLVARHTHAAT